MIDKIKLECTGCSACKQICPQKCISMEMNEEGFLYPQINKKLCVNCNICESVCPAMKVELDLPIISESKIFGVKWNGNKEDIYYSASGGIFFALAKFFLAQGGVVFGAIFDANYKVVHYASTSLEGIKKMQNSKYVQSEIKDSYIEIEELLKKDEKRYILFSGTPCQCAGLKTYLKNDYPNLLVVDFVCHGVPSPLIFEKYLHWLSKTLNETVKDYQFRTKRHGWNYKGRMISNIRMNSHSWPVVYDPYLMCFLKALNYRESCYLCKYGNSKKYADITLGDFGGVRQEYPYFFNRKGCSISLFHTKRGLSIFEEIKKEFDYIEVDFKIISKYNKNLLSPCKRPSIRDSIYSEVQSMSDNDYIEKVLRKQIEIKDIANYYIPYKLKQVLKVYETCFLRR